MFCSFSIRGVLVIYEPTMNNRLELLCYQIAICCLRISVLWGIQRLPPTLIMNLKFVLQGGLTMALKGLANPDGLGKKIYTGIKVCCLVARWLPWNRWASEALWAHWDSGSKVAAAALYTQADDAFVSVDWRYAFREVRRDVGFLAYDCRSEAEDNNSWFKANVLFTQVG